MRETVPDPFDCIVDVSGTDPTMLDVALAVPSIASCPRYVFISSASVYDRTYSQLPFRETAQGGGDSIWAEYGSLKWDCEERLRAKRRGGLYILRPPYVYGPHNPDLREQFVWSRTLNGRRVPVPGDGLRKLQFCYVRDLADCVANLVEMDGSSAGIFNIAGDEVVTQRQYVELCAKVAGTGADLQHVFQAGLKAREYFPFRDADFYLDVSKIRQAKVYSPTTLEAGLAETLEWFRENQPGDLEPRLSMVETD